MAEEGRHIIINNIKKSLTEDAAMEILKTSNAKVVGLPGDSGDLEFIREVDGFDQKEFRNLR